MSIEEWPVGNPACASLLPISSGQGQAGRAELKISCCFGCGCSGGIECFLRGRQLAPSSLEQTWDASGNPRSTVRPGNSTLRLRVLCPAQRDGGGGGQWRQVQTPGSWEMGFHMSSFENLLPFFEPSWRKGLCIWELMKLPQRKSGLDNLP